MKKDNPETIILNTDTAREKDLDTTQIKTTNINILLNRVRLDRKRTFKKRIIFSVFLACVVSSIAVYFII